MLTRDNFTGPWAGLPVAWTDDDKFDEATFRSDVRSCCEANVPGIYTGGTTGEFYAMEFDEFQQVARAAVEEAHNTPVMIGVSSTYTLGAVRRAEFAAEIGADAIQVALPFWMEIGEDQIVPFFQQVAAAIGDRPLSIYETTRAKRTLTIRQHQAIQEAVPQYMMVKANAGTIGSTEEGCAALSRLVNVFVGEGSWRRLCPHGAIGACSSVVYWNPHVLLDYWNRISTGKIAEAGEVADKLDRLFEFLGSEFAPRGFTDTAFDRMGGVASGFLATSLRSRGPYPSATPGDVEILRHWYQHNFPEMLQLS